MSYAAPLDAFFFLLAKYQIYALLFLVGFLPPNPSRDLLTKGKTFFFLPHMYSINLKGSIRKLPNNSLTIPHTTLKQ